ncbi:MAG: hypothetical protein QOD92_4425 [Acidimicrobiaceae bacterium]
MMKRKSWAAVAAVVLAVPTVLMVTATPASATDVSDEASLRAAFPGASGTIDLTADITLSNCGAGDVARDSATPLTVDGHGHTITQTCPGLRVLLATGDGGLTVQNATLTGGDTTSFGGAVHYKGSAALNIVNSTITGNHADSAGGGVEGDQLHITNSVFSDNSSDDFCAAACSATTIDIVGSSFTNHSVGELVIATGDDKLTITNSSITGNSAGGVFGGTSVTVSGSTIANNVATGDREAVASTGELKLTNSTVSNNTAVSAAVNAPTVTLVYATVVDNTVLDDNSANVSAETLNSFGSVVALPHSAPNCDIDTTTSHGFNFSDDDTCGFTNAAEHDRETAGDPGLGALANNGGSTQTRKPGATSPLLNFIPLASCKNDGASGISTDQVGTTRPQETGCEIGAFEVPVPGAPPATPVDVAPSLTG